MMRENQATRITPGISERIEVVLMSTDKMNLAAQRLKQFRNDLAAVGNFHGATVATGERRFQANAEAFANRREHIFC